MRCNASKAEKQAFIPRILDRPQGATFATRLPDPSAPPTPGVSPIEDAGSDQLDRLAVQFERAVSATRSPSEC